MSVSSVAGQFQPAPAAQDNLQASLQKDGLTAATAQSVGSEISAVVDSVVSGSSGQPDPTAIRSAIDKQINSDVASGKLTQDQAKAVTTTLNSLAQQGSQPPAGGPPPGGGAAPSGNQSSSGAKQSSGSGGGGGSSSAKTEVSSTSTTHGHITTTVITYSDGSKATKTSYGSSAVSSNQPLSDLVAANNSLSPKDRGVAANYLGSVVPTGLVADTVA